MQVQGHHHLPVRNHNNDFQTRGFKDNELMFGGGKVVNNYYGGESQQSSNGLDLSKLLDPLSLLGGGKGGQQGGGILGAVGGLLGGIL